jgi:histidine phosphotransfer protein HptB
MNAFSSSPPPGPAVPVAAPVAAAEPSRLDEAALARLRELDPDGRHGVVERVMGAFSASLVRTLEDLRADRAPPGADTLRTIAHTLKSSSASVGAVELASACAEIERRLRAGGTDDLPGDCARLEAECERALQAVEAMLHA